jgi:hypothetical protein
MPCPSKVSQKTMSEENVEPNNAFVALNQKMARATAAMAAVTKTKKADLGNYSYTYATLTDVLQTVKDALDTQGLALMQPLVTEGTTMLVTTLVVDKDSGESMSFGGPGIALKGDPQAMGSAISYYRRYALTSLFGLEVDDDDGQQANRSAVKPTERTGAETEIREIIGLWNKDERAMFARDFKAHFNSNLTDLPESRHGDALAFTKAWENGDNLINVNESEAPADEV